MKQKDILFILISTTILTLCWIVFNIIHHAKSSTITQNVNQTIAPIQAKFDRQVLESLQQRQNITPLYSLPTNQATPSAPNQDLLNKLLPTSGQQPASQAGSLNL